MKINYDKKQFKEFMKIADNPFTTFRQKAEQVLGKKLNYQEIICFKEKLEKWIKKQKQAVGK